MASEANVDINRVEGSGKKWCNLKRGHNELDGI